MTKKDLAQAVLNAQSACPEFKQAAKEAKANGAVYCNCPGFTAAKDIIDNFRF